jgi:hypothetical protein
MRRRYDGLPPPGWRQLLAQHSSEIWACDLFTVQTLWFRRLYVFFVIHHGSHEIIHARVTAHPNSQWLAQQMLEACGLSTDAPKFLIHDRDSSFGAVFDRRVKSFDGDRIETWAREHPVQDFGDHGKRQPGELLPHRSSAGCIMCTNGQLDNSDGVFAPYTR